MRLLCDARVAQLDSTTRVLPSYLPTNTRLQIDGVNTNWGKTTIAHVTQLVNNGILGKTVVARNPVGNTHEVHARAARARPRAPKQAPALADPGGRSCGARAIGGTFRRPYGGESELARWRGLSGNPPLPGEREIARAIARAARVRHWKSGARAARARPRAPKQAARAARAPFPTRAP